MYAVGGDFFTRLANNSPVSALISVFLADGSSSVVLTTNSAFVGFISDVAISQIKVSSYDPVGMMYPAADTLYFGVPTPGAVALLGLAGLISRRRR